MNRSRSSNRASRARPFVVFLGLWTMADTGAVAGLEGQSPTSGVRVLARAGGVDAAGPTTFGRIEALELADDGGFYVLDSDFHELRAFAADGSHRWSLGREGEGPGEFVYPVGLTRGPDGHLWVIDPEAQRATVVRRTGELVATHRLPAGVALSPWPGRFDAAGRLYSYVEADRAEYAIDIVRYGADLRREATFTPPSPPEPESYFEGRTARGSDLRARIPFTPRLVWRLDAAGRFVWVWTADPRLMRSDRDGRSREVGIVPADAVRVSAAEREAALESLGRFRQMGGRIEPDRIPDRKPPIRTFVLDDRDRAWVMASRDGETSVWWIVDPAGAPVRSLELPVRLEAFPTPVVRGSTLVGVERDDLGVERVVLLEVAGR